MNNIATILAATIIFVVEKEEGIKILLVKRAEHLSFAAKNYAFPGGKIAPIDFQLAHNNLLKAAKIAAIRETYEEVGIFIGLKNDNILLPHKSEVADRIAIAKSPQLFKSKFDKFKNDFDFTKLLPLSRWQPPNEFNPKFDTYFFIYQLDEECELLIDKNELSETLWISPQNAFENYENKTMDFLFPTIVTISLLAKINKISEIKNFIKWEIPELTKGEIKIKNGKPYQFIDKELGYPLYHIEILS